MIIATSGSDPATVHGFISVGMWETATVTVASFRITGTAGIVVVVVDDELDTAADGLGAAAPEVVMTADVSASELTRARAVRRPLSATAARQ
jgi:hypothetical protein